MVTYSKGKIDNNHNRKKAKTNVRLESLKKPDGCSELRSRVY